MTDRRIAVVTGDDLMPRLDALLQGGWPFANLDTGEPLATVRPRVVSANAYLGARPLAEALRLGASIVITGRVADASLTLGPAVHEFGWAWDDWDRLAGATVAGHLIECGAQATGGLWCNWQEAADLADVGYPIAEMSEDGSFLLTKPPGTGGAVNRETVAEQLLYEVGDPAAYLTPDVVADFTSVHLTERGRDMVHVGGGRGKPATDTYKVSIAYRDGCAASGTLVIAGPGAAAKARRCGEIVLERLRRAGAESQHSHVEVIGDRRVPAGAGLGRSAGGGVARCGPRRPPCRGRALHEGTGAAGHVRPARRHRLHHWPAGRARGIRLLAVVSPEGCDPCGSAASRRLTRIGAATVRERGEGLRRPPLPDGRGSDGRPWISKEA